MNWEQRLAAHLIVSSVIPIFQAGGSLFASPDHIPSAAEHLQGKI